MSLFPRLETAADTPDSRIAFAFPGVGVAPCGAEPEFVTANRSVVEPFLAEGSDWAGVDLEGALAGAPLEEMTPRSFQLLTYAFSCSAAAVFRSAGVRPAWIAGYSSGIYAALWAAGCFSYADGLALVARAYEVMTGFVTGKGPFAMGVIVGLSRGEVDGLLSRCPSLGIANVNSDFSVVFGGLAAEVKATLADALQAGASRAKLLPADAPIHHLVLSAVSRTFREHMEELDWKAPECPVVCSIDQSILTEPAALKDFTAANLSTPIHWQRVVETLVGQGVEMVFECGHGVSLTQNARFIPLGPRHANVRNWQRVLSR